MPTTHSRFTIRLVKDMTKINVTMPHHTSAPYPRIRVRCVGPSTGKQHQQPREGILKYQIKDRVDYSFDKFWSLVLLLDSGTINNFGIFWESGTFKG